MSKKLLALAMIATFGFSVAASAEITPTVKKGSSRARVTEVQEALNACGAELSTDGLWGAKTTAAVKAFQADNDLSKVGFVGPATAALLNDCLDSEDEDTTTTTTTTTTTSADLCPNGMTLASNCTAAPVTTTTTTVSGPEGNLTNITKLGSYNNTKVSESDKDIKVMGIELTAKDGDQKIDGLNIGFSNSNGSSSTKFTKYAQEVSVWLDGVEIGRKLTSQFSDDAGSPAVYTYRFSGMNGVVKMNQKSQLIVAVSAVGSMDSADATNETWTAFVGGTVGGADDNFISAASANGRYRDFGTATISSSIDFQKAGGVSSDQKFKVTTASTNPVAQTVQVSTTADTTDKVLLSFDAKAENGAMVVQKLPVSVATVDGTSDGVAPLTNAIVKSVKLYANGVKIADESVPQDGTDSALETVIFGNSSKLAYKIAANETVKFEVRADLNDTENTGVAATDFDNGDKVSVSFTSTNLTNSTIELDNANQDTVSNKTGSASGENQTLRSTGMQLTMGTVTSTDTQSTAGLVISRTYTVPVSVKAFDDTMYIGKSVENSSAALATGLTSNNASAVGYTIEDSAGATYAVAVGAGTMGSASATWNSTDAAQSSVTCTGVAAPVASCTGAGTIESFRVDSGATKNFNLVVVVSDLAAGTANSQFRIQLNKIQGFTSGSLLPAEVIAQDLTPSNSFETGYYTVAVN